MISSLRAKLTLLVAAGAFVAALTTFLVGGDVVRGTASIGTEFTATYPDACADLQNAAADCSLCHAPVPALNGYGADLAAAINDFAAIEGEDS
ncbi:MAG: hypothetical protein GTO22_12100, partial [Gemmatimonadales bacterium]|nr:hypothetical protein [Gemmatimonadales bacterium]